MSVISIGTAVSTLDSQPRQTEAQALSIPLGSETLHATRAKNDGTLVTHLSGEGVQVFGAREALKRHPRRVCHPPRKSVFNKKKTRTHADIYIFSIFVKKSRHPLFRFLLALSYFLEELLSFDLWGRPTTFRVESISANFDSIG